MPRRQINHDAVLINRATALGIDATPHGAGLWRVNGVVMTRDVLRGNIKRAESGQSTFQCYRTRNDEARSEAQLQEVWKRARALGVTITLHPNGLVSINAGEPRLLIDINPSIGRARGRRAATPNDPAWELANRAQAVFGEAVFKRGSYWFRPSGGSFTTERLEQIVTAAEAREKAA